MQLTASYVNQSGVPRSRQQAPFLSPGAGSSAVFSFQTGDTALMDVLATGWSAVVNAGGEGVMAVEIIPTRALPAL